MQFIIFNYLFFYYMKEKKLQFRYKRKLKGGMDLLMFEKLKIWIARNIY